jgi:hypothetical protein
MPQKKRFGKKVLVFVLRLVFQSLCKKDVSYVVALDKRKCFTVKYVPSHFMGIVWMRSQWTRVHGAVITVVPV